MKRAIHMKVNHQSDKNFQKVESPVKNQGWWKEFPDAGAKPGGQNQAPFFEDRKYHVNFCKNNHNNWRGAVYF